MPKPRPPRDETEFRSVADLIQRVFADEATTQAHLALVQSSAFVPECLPTIWHPDGHALAVVQAVPCKIALLGDWVPGGIITMVATIEDARGQGYMRACMHAAHEWLKNAGYPLAILYGVPQIYPRFGYRPVMARSEVCYPTPETVTTGNLREATSNDLAAMTMLFNQQDINRSCSIQRQAEPWIWQGGAQATSVVDGVQEITGYARYTLQDTSTLDVAEAAILAGQESVLLDALHTHAAECGARSVRLRLMPDHPLVQEVSRRATHLELSDVQIAVQPPQAGMLCVLDAESVLQLLQPHLELRLPGQGLRLEIGNRDGVQIGVEGPTVRIPHEADVAHLLSGYPGVPALRQWHLLQTDQRGAELAGVAFPTGWPRWSYAPFWGE